MEINTAERLDSQPEASFTKDELRGALNNWRRDVLNWLGREMLQASQDFRDAEDGLAIAQQNPGEVASDVIDYLWEKLNAKGILLHRLDQVVQRIEEMDLPALLILFRDTSKISTYPWEDEKWQLPASIF